MMRPVMQPVMQKHQQLQWAMAANGTMIQPQMYMSNANGMVGAPMGYYP